MSINISSHEKIDDVKISVIVPVYNCEKYIEKCIESVLNQGIDNIEIICVDDASTDNSLKLITELSQADRRIVILQNDKNEGNSFTRNHGLEIAKGDYILFLDADDWYSDGAIVELYSIAEGGNYDIVYFDAQCHFEDGIAYDKGKVNYYIHGQSYGKCTGKQILEWMTLDSNFTDSACLMFIRRRWLENKGISFYNGIIFEDCLFSVTCMLNSDNVYHTNCRYYQYRVRNNSILNSDRFTAINMYSRAIIMSEFLKLYVDFPSVGLINMILFVRDNIRNINGHISDVELKKYNTLFPINDDISLVFKLCDVDVNRIKALSFIEGAYEKINNAVCIEIFGAGKRGKRLLDYLRLKKISDRVNNFIVSEKMDEYEDVSKIPICVMSEGYLPDYENLIIIAIAGNPSYAILRMLLLKKYKNIVLIDNYFYNHILDELVDSGRKED